MVEVLDGARRSIEAGDFQGALQALPPLAPGPHDAETLEVLAVAAYGAGDLEGAIGAWEQAHDLHAAAGSAGEAARAATMVAMYLLIDSGLMSPIRAWLGRARRHLEDQPEGPTHALVAMVAMYERFMCGDMAAAHAIATEAIDLGTRHEVPPATVMGRTCRARVMIQQGGAQIGAGILELDGVAMDLMAGVVDPLTTGMVWCELICAVQGLGRYDLTTQWTDAMEKWRHGAAFGGIHGRCRVHRAEVLRLRGACGEAEDEALQACEELRPWMRREFGWPLTELGLIRYRKGDLAGAEEAFLAAHETAWDPQPGLALVHLARGDHATALALLEAALSHPVDVPSKERPPNVPLRRVPILDALAQSAAAAGDVEEASSAAGELELLAAQFPGPAFEAIAALARARAHLAAGAPDDAAAAAERSVGHWAEIGAPWDMAAARLVLGEALLASGATPRASLELGAARAAFDRLGASFWAERAGSLLSDPPRPAAAAEVGAGVGAGSDATGVFRCEGDMRTIAWAGLTVHVHDLKGLRYLERLLAEPGREFHVVDLIAVESGTLPTGRDRGNTSPLLDDQARAAYRRRLAECEQEIEEAQRNNDPARADLARADRDHIVHELSRAVGLGGRDRRPTSTSERARYSVTRALRYGLARVAEHHAPLAAHLQHAIRTGTYCAYEPDPNAPMVWET